IGPGNPRRPLHAYLRNRKETNWTAIQGSPVAPYIVDHVRTNGTWTGNASDLWHYTREAAGAAAEQDRDWPKNAKLLSQHLRKLEPNLRETGVNVEFDRTGKERTITMEWTGGDGRPDVCDATPLPGDAAGDAEQHEKLAGSRSK